MFEKSPILPIAVVIVCHGRNFRSFPPFGSRLSCIDVCLSVKSKKPLRKWLLKISNSASGMEDGENGILKMIFIVSLRYNVSARGVDGNAWHRFEYTL